MSEAPGQRQMHSTTIADLIAAGLVRPGERLVFMRTGYAGSASVNADGTVNYDGVAYKTPSAAGKALREGAETNGWYNWAVIRGDSRVRLTELRKQYEAGAELSTSASAVQELEQPRGVASAAPVDLDGSADELQDVADPSDATVPQAADLEEAESSGLIAAFGMFWRRDSVDWRRSSAPPLHGHLAGSDIEVDFSEQVGVYLLHDGARTTYVGRVTKPRLGRRLFEHTKDRLSGRWDRFSWFGLRPVLVDGTLGEAAETFGTDLVVGTMEAVLIEGLEPVQNRRGGDYMTGQEYQQIVDPGLLQDQGLVALMNAVRSSGR
ncbi:hypothetical protein V6N00_13695 [Tersicoccus sp. MR15.9]|uniref:restriction system modified-DNA reader domain-containing protein n=1 Tax=Tersicoccus mangrovi TaxID=3121635 RepID=UPI002FE52D4F